MKVVRNKPEQSKQLKATKKKEVITKLVNVVSFDITRGKKTVKANKLQKWLIEKMWGLSIQESYFYNGILRYSGGNIQEKDILVSKEGDLFYVINSNHNTASIVSYNPLPYRPIVVGKIQVNRENINFKKNK